MRPTNLYITVPKEQEASYAAIIDSILAKSDLDSVSKKKVRKELTDRVGYDVSAQKVCASSSNLRDRC